MKKSVRTKKTGSIKEKASAVHQQTYGGFRETLFWCFMGLLFISPYPKGMFFPYDQQKALFFSLLLFASFCFWKRQQNKISFLNHPLDYFMLALPLVYLISAFGAANYGLAIDKVVEYILYFTVYWCAFQLISGKRHIENMLYTIYLAAIGVALAGLFTTTGIISISDGFLSGRIASTFQYSNGLASYLMAVVILSMYLWYKTAHPLKPLSYLFLSGNYLLMAVFFGARSQGSFLVLIMAVVALIIILPVRKRLLLMVHFLLIAIAGSVCIQMFVKNVQADQGGLAWLWVMAGIPVVIILHALFFKLISLFSFKNRSLKITALVLTVLLVFTLIAVLVSAGIGPNIISGKTSSLMHRVYFVGDAFKMLMERPVFGWGGGGWREAYQHYQSYSYYSTQVHSHYAQLAVETGIIGILIVAGLWVFFLRSGWRVYHSNDNPDERALVTFLIISAMALGVHAAIDFDLSLSAISIVLYSLMAAIRNIEKRTTIVDEKIRGVRIKKNLYLVTSVISLVLLILTGAMVTASSNAKKANNLIKYGQLKQAQDYGEKAVFYNPCNSEYRLKLASIYSSNGLMDKAREQAEKALSRSRYNPYPREYLAKLAFDLGDYGMVNEYTNKVLDLAPWQVHSYEFAGVAYSNAGIKKLKESKEDEALKFFDETLSLPGKIERQLNSIKDFKHEASIRNNFKTTTKIMFTTGLAHFFKGDLQEAENNFKAAADDNDIRGDSYIWLSIISEKRNDLKSAESYLKSALEISPNLKGAYDEYRAMIF